MLKLRGGMMPPTGRPRPDRAALDRFVSALEGRLDEAAKGAVRKKVLSAEERTYEGLDKLFAAIDARREPELDRHLASHEPFDEETNARQQLARGELSEGDGRNASRQLALSQHHVYVARVLDLCQTKAIDSDRSGYF